MKETLAQIDAPDAPDRKGFHAGVVLWDDVVIEAAPIIRYMRKWTRDRVRNYCAGKGWSVTVVHELERAKP